jgi:probable F420-dependent oxidoreductase
MKFGVSLNNRGPLATPENLIRFARQAEALGFDSITASDHVVIPKAMPSNYPYHPEGAFRWQAARNYYEPLTTLMVLAGATERIRLGTSVLIVPYRNPVIVAKMLATLDVLSRGRVFLGVGTGWWEDEFKALGIPGHFTERGPRTDESIRIFRNLWGEERPAFKGRFYAYDDLEFSPKPVQRGGIPIWIGGHTTRALRRAAELGNAWHPIGLRPPAGLKPEEMERKLIELEGQCHKAGRNFSDLLIAFRCPVVFTDTPREPVQGTPEQIAADLRAYRQVGVGHVTFDVPGESFDAVLETLERVAKEVLPLLR